MNAKLIPSATLAAAAFLIGGCASQITNLTNEEVPRNPSGIYTLTMKTNVEEGKVVEGSYQPRIVIDGETYPMVPAGIGGNTYDYEYRMPPGREEARYYYLLEWQEDTRGKIRDREAQSPLQQLKIIDRYVIQMESQRGPVGAEIPIVGRGFSEADTVVFGGYEAQTQYYSPTSISFIVPPVDAGQAYPVEVHSGTNVYFGGSFFVDQAEFMVRPSSVEVASGDRALINIAIPNPAPAGGLLVDVTTDVPESIIMPEVVIPAGKRVIAVPMEGGAPGSGNLYVGAPGFDEITVPVTVR